MFTKIVLYRVKPNKVQQWLNWCSSLQNNHIIELRNILDAENIEREFFTTFTINGEVFAIGGEIAPRKPNYTETDLSKEHARQKKECLEYISKPGYSYIA